MNTPVDHLLHNFTRHLDIPWSESASGTERVWYLVYPPEEERRLRAHITAFQDATENSKHKWIEFDLTRRFGTWLESHPQRERVLASPEKRLAKIAPAFERSLEDDLRRVLIEEADPDTLVMLVGLGSLFGVTSVSRLVKAVADDVPGRLGGFFPGRWTDQAYHLLNGDGDWNYMATPITSNPERR